MRTKRRTRSYRFNGLDEDAAEPRRTPTKSMVVSAVRGPRSERRRCAVEVSEVGPISERVALRAFKQLGYELLGLAAGSRVLDVGCGTGEDVRGLAQAVGPTGVVYGVDVAPDVVDGAERVAPEATNTRFVVADALGLPFPAGRFDAVHAHRVLQEVSDASRGVDEMLRVCTAGGRIVLGEVDWDTLVVADGDTSAVGALREGCRQRFPSPRIGSQLATMLVERGCRDVMVVPTAATYRCLMTAERDLELLDGLVRARDAGDITDAAALALRRRLEGVDAANGFFASLTGFIVAATKQ
jgi:SAM-dependent methyltransferase